MFDKLFNLTKEKVEDAMSYVVSSLGAAGVFGGVLTQNEWTALSGAFATIAGVGWAVYLRERKVEKADANAKPKKNNKSE